MEDKAHNTFPKREHLKSEKELAELFSNGVAFIVYPMRIVFMKVQPDRPVPVCAMFGAPKKHFRHAVDRNRMKRLMREAYRRQKHTLVSFVERQDYRLNMAVSIVSPNKFSYEELYSKMGKALDIIISKLS